MRCVLTIPYIVGLLSLGVESIQLVERLVKRSNPAAIGLNIQRDRAISTDVWSKVKKRESTIKVTLDNAERYYFANVTVGMPGQFQRLTIDTGSSDTWFNWAESLICQNDTTYCPLKEGCCLSGTYNPNASSSYVYVSSDFSIDYQDQSGVRGDYATDVLKVDGVLGIGYMANEAFATDSGKRYPNVPQALVDQGFIKCNAYSLWLNDLDSATGQLLFGGVNTEKYIGNLTTFPIRQSPLNDSSSGPIEFLIDLDGIGITDAHGKSESINDTSTLALLDAGATSINLHPDAVRTIYRRFNVTMYQGLAFVPCSTADDLATVDFRFGTMTIRVPLGELVFDPDYIPPDLSTPECVFGIDATEPEAPNILGDTFLRSAYVVYDLDYNEISLAPTKFNSTSDNIKEIGTGRGSVPGATGARITATLNPSVTYATAAKATHTSGAGAKGEVLVAALTAITDSSTVYEKKQEKNGIIGKPLDLRDVQEDGSKVQERASYRPLVNQPLRWKVPPDIGTDTGLPHLMVRTNLISTGYKGNPNKGYMSARASGPRSNGLLSQSFQANKRTHELLVIGGYEGTNYFGKV
ncbi:hypothetical protein FGG08_004407 [Glutinoglossum americanum]|uniref:Peptidase A1 domain-containing protein n=1 Tax=Glutinoglossum americanum TaxID=1670608 RepID=A0A9P8HWH1_9PEZI|nr:hypothetical protein FGG08_004407 [Glutinoglossum americanum]